MQKYLLRIVVTTLVLFSLVACNLPTSQVTGTTANSTAVIETAIANAQATLTAMAGGIIPNSPIIPGILITETPTLTAIPSFTSTPEGFRLSVSEETNCRMGPGVEYDRIGSIKPSQSAEVLGRNTANLFWYIRLPDNPAWFCWVWGNYATVTGNTTLIPIMTPPPTPTVTITPTPNMDFTVVYAGKDMCAAWYLRYKVVNTGGTIIQSIKIVSFDITASNTYTATYDIFQDWSGCLTGTTNQDLTPGESGKTNSGASILADPIGHNFEATVTVCSQNGLTGACLTKKINFTP